LNIGEIHAGEDRMAYNEEEILTGQEARDLLKISRSTLWKLTREKQIPAYRVGNGKTSNLRYKKSELIEWLNSNRVNAMELGSEELGSQ
jgi:excisionase family DNA binding protein